MSRHPENELVPGLAIVRAEAGLFFANSEGVRERIEELAAEDGVKAVLLDAESIPSIDLTAADMLDQLAEKLDRQGQELILAKDIGQVRQILTASASTLKTYANLDDAVAAFRKGQAADGQSADPRAA